MPYMYILRCSDGTLYTGSTWDLSHRMDQHDPGSGATSTSRRPLTLVYFEHFDRIDEAYYREREIHGWTRWKKDRLIAGGPCGRDPPESVRVCRPAGCERASGLRPNGQAAERSGWRHPSSVPA
ncbi:GIY-YIG nuclease family protein [Mycetocola sp.]|uniref:GIY-YIG nuclease family protein n=1 Tax=Mycetocola sp. TaxID=1871042 RepID=UPI003989A7B6